MRRNDVASTSFRRRVPTRFLINRCQIITFLILKYDIIENSRIELRGIVLPIQVGGLLGGGGWGGGQRVCWPPFSNYWGPGPPAPPPLPKPMLRDEDMGISTMISTNKTSVTDATSQVLGKERCERGKNGRRSGMKKKEQNNNGTQTTGFRRQ